MSGKLLVPIDFSDVTSAILYEAKRLAMAFQYKIYLVHVRHTPSSCDYGYGAYYMQNPIAEDLEHEQDELKATARALRDEGLEVDSTFMQGSPAKGIIEQMRRIKPDFILLGSHGHGALTHMITGSVCSHVTRKATCPVIIVPSKFLSEVEELEEHKECLSPST